MQILSVLVAISVVALARGADTVCSWNDGECQSLGEGSIVYGPGALVLCEVKTDKGYQLCQGVITGPKQCDCRDVCVSAQDVPVSELTGSKPTYKNSLANCISLEWQESLKQAWAESEKLDTNNDIGLTALLTGGPIKTVDGNFYECPNTKVPCVAVQPYKESGRCVLNKAKYSADEAAKITEQNGGFGTSDMYLCQYVTKTLPIVSSDPVYLNKERQPLYFYNKVTDTKEPLTQCGFPKDMDFFAKAGRDMAEFGHCQPEAVCVATNENGVNDVCGTVKDPSEFVEYSAEAWQKQISELQESNASTAGSTSIASNGVIIGVFCALVAIILILIVALVVALLFRKKHASSHASSSQVRVSSHRASFSSNDAPATRHPRKGSVNSRSNVHASA